MICKRCGKFNCFSIPIPKDEFPLEATCADCNYILCEFFKGVMGQQN